MDWHKLTKKTMPPEETAILLWLDYGHEGFPVCGCRSGDSITYASNWQGLQELAHDEWRRTRWAVIESPEENEKERSNT